jgi:hypothetical protein
MPDRSTFVTAISTQFIDTNVKTSSKIKPKWVLSFILKRLQLTLKFREIRPLVHPSLLSVS